MPAVCGALALVLGGAWNVGAAQTAHFAGAQSVIANNANNSLVEPFGVAVDGSGSVYIAAESNEAVFKETPSAGGYTQTVVANYASNGLGVPQGVAVDGSGNVYIADSTNRRVLKETLSAGSYTQSIVASSAAGGLSTPCGVAVDGSGNVYIVDADNYRVLKETLSAGGYTQSVVANAPTNDLGYQGVAVDSFGNVYIVDSENSVVLKETFSAGTYTQTVFANAANNGLSHPWGVAVDGNGNVYIADYVNGRVLEETLSAGSYTQSVVANAANNGLDAPSGVAVDDSGNVYIADPYHNQVLEETLSGGNFGAVNVGSASTTPIPMIFAFDTAGTLGSTAVVTQGATGLDFANAGTGTCTVETAYTVGETCTVDVSFTPRFAGTRDGAAELLDGLGNVLATGYVQGTGVGPQVNFLPGTQSVVADQGTNGLSGAQGVAVDGSGNVYIIDYQNNQVLKETMSAAGYTQSVIANNANNGLDYSYGIAVDGGGNVYIVDRGNSRVLKETMFGGSYTQTVVANSANNGLSYPEGVAADGSGNVYIADGNGRVLKETLSVGGYTQTVVANSANNGPQSPSAVAVDGRGNVYITDNGKSQVLKETPSGGSYAQSVVANSTDNGLSYPDGVAVDGSGNVYIVDSGNSRVLKETLSGGSYTQSVVANPANNGLYSPYGVAMDGRGNVYIADFGNNRVLKEDFTDPPSLSFATTAYGAISTNSPQTVTVENVGNAALSFTIPANGNNPSISSNFTLNSSGTSACQVENSSTDSAETLAPNASCDLVISFEPELGGAPGGSLVLTDNNLNAPAPGYASQSIALSGSIIPATPTINWAAPAAITYGTPLSTTQLDATSPVAGTFTYSPAGGTVLTGGQQTLATTFTPTNTLDYTTATATVTLTVNPATPAITWAAPAAISFGTALSAAQLDASSPVAGTFTYSPAAGTVLGVRSHTITTTFTPTDSTDYTGASSSITLVVNQATPAITWPTPAAITYGTALGAAQLDATSPGAGYFAYSPAAGTVLVAGPQTLKATFTPTDTTDYSTATATATLTVNEATPTITWPTPAAITYGAGLGSAQLDATSSVAGSFAYSPVSGTVLGAGPQTLTATFTPTDTTDYKAAKATITLTVNQAAPTINWATPAAITSGTALSATQLDATATVPGTFVYNPAPGTAPPVGNDTLSVIFTPTDNVDYATATASVTLTVNVPLNPVPFLGNITPAIADAGGAAFTITVNGSGFLPNSIVYWGTTALITQFVSSTQLTATVTAASVAIPGATAVNVQTPAPGGGTSDVLQFEVDSPSAITTAPTVPSTVVTVTAGTTATYSISFPASVTNATATCLNLPAGAICSYSFATGVLTISTSSTTPAGTYQVTVVFAETITDTSSAFILLPFLLLPLFFLRKKLTSHGIWPAVWLSLILLAATAFSVGCGGSSSPAKTLTTTTQSVTSSGVVGMTVQ